MKLNKGVKKCFGLLLVLFIMSLLSLGVFSDESFAYKYDIDSFNIGRDHVYNFYKIRNHAINYDPYDESQGDYYLAFPQNYDFVVNFLTSDTPSSFQFPKQRQIVGQLSSGTNCNFYGNYTSYYTAPGYAYTTPNGLFLNTSSPKNDRSGFFLTSYNWRNIITPEYSPFDFTLSAQTASNASYLNALCSMYGTSYENNLGQNPSAYPYRPIWHWNNLSSIPINSGRYEFQENVPYTYNFDRIALKNTRVENGVYYTTNGISTKEIFNSDTFNFNQLSMNFTLFNESYNDISDWSVTNESYRDSISNFNFYGSLLIDSDYSLSSNSSSGILLDFDYFNISSTPPSFEKINDKNVYFASNIVPYSGSVEKQCSITEYHTSNGDEENRIDFVCSYNPLFDGGNSTIDFRYSRVALLFNGGVVNGSSTNTYYNFFSDGAHNITFKDFYIVTNDDSTISPVGSATSSPSGGNIDASPGAGTSHTPPNPEDADWFTSLTSLFNFNFINPFAPIFNLFSNQNSCAQIPILAGLIHSEESEVCPWFSSSVRDILTPVLGLSSMMLVFGFAVRWLGSSSGNLFEDSGSIEPPGYSATGGTAIHHGWRRKK